MTINPEKWLLHKRVVRFGEADPAGVIHFYQLLRWCHEAWEESLECYGISVSEIFPDNSRFENNPEISLPIIHCEADFRAPIKTGDNLIVKLAPKVINLDSFQVQFQFSREGQEVAVGLIRHLAINSLTRKRCALPKVINRWLEASSLSLGLQAL